MTPITLISKQLEASNRALSDAVSSLNITDSEYDILTGLCDNTFGGYDRDRVRRWLGPAKTQFAMDINKLQTRILRLPYNRMPLLINSAEPTTRILSMWRLKIGR